MSLSRDLARALDASSIMRELGLKPDAWQAELLAERPDRVLLCMSRQVGKSTTASIIALHLAPNRGPEELASSTAGHEFLAEFSPSNCL